MSQGSHVGGARLSTLKLARVLARLAATLSARDRKHGQGRCATGHATGAVADHNGELFVVVLQGEDGRRIAGRGRARDCHAVEHPLILERHAAGRSNGKGRGCADPIGLALRLSGYRRRGARHPAAG